MAEGTKGPSAVQVLPTGDSTTVYVAPEQAHSVFRHSNTHNTFTTHTGRPLMMEGNNNSNAHSGGVPYIPNSNSYGNPYNHYNTNNNQFYSQFNQYNNNPGNNYYGGYGSYNRDYNNYNPGYKSGNGSYNSNPSNNADMMNDNDCSVVDSALLAALRDSRERVALLKLEQVMIDFMNAPEGYLEVGGHYNSVVVSPNTSNKRFQSAANVTDAGGRQTSFQRCILHRLADRFGIIRESGTILEGSIRLIKQKDSKIPKMLLLDHVEADSSLTNSNSTSSSSNNKGGESETRNSSTDDGRTSSQQPSASGAPPTKDKSKRKMKIMKRNSSAESGGGQAKSTPRSRKNKNFSDKEKAYAEARARIFADEAAINASSSGGIKSAPASMAPSPSATPPPSGGGAPSNPSSRDATPVHKSSSTSNLTLPRRMSSSSLTSDVNNNSSTEESGVPPAAASSGVSKATWRNRKEEENDPDFQRGAGLQTLVPVAAVAAAAPAYNVPLGGSTYYYQAGGGPVAAAAAPAASYGYYQHGEQHYNGNVRGGRGFVAAPRGYGYPQQPPSHQHYRANTNGNGEATNVNCMDEFPALR